MSEKIICCIIFYIVIQSCKNGIDNKNNHDYLPLPSISDSIINETTLASKYDTIEILDSLSGRIFRVIVLKDTVP